MLVTVLCVSLVPVFGTEEVRTEQTGIVSEQTPTRVILYAEEQVDNLLGTALEMPELVGLDKNKNINFRLGNPFRIYNLEGQADETYFFPILEGDDIVLMLSVMKTGQELSACISKSLVDELQTLKSSLTDSPYILYSNGNKLYAENKANKTVLKVNNFDSQNEEVISSENLSYDKKINQLIGNEKNVVRFDESIRKIKIDSRNMTTKSIYNTKASSGGIGRLSSNPFLINNSFNKVLNTNGCHVNQRDKNGKKRGLCWAACVATSVRYYKGVANVYAYTIADKMNVNYDDGAGISTMKSALSTYGMSYTAKADTVSFSTLKNQIGNKRCVIICGANAKVGGHAVTMFGYADSTSKTISLWDSNDESVIVSTYISSSAFNFTSGGQSFTWIKTVY